MASQASNILPIYVYGSSVLKKKAEPVKEMNDEVVALIMSMMQTMKKANGVGLAANQVGSLQRVITIDASGIHDDEEAERELFGDPRPVETTRPLVLINPEIIETQGAAVMEEGCLSVPHLRFEIERPAQVTLKYRDASFKEQTLKADRYLARVIQHEYDHLEGILLTDRISKKEQQEVKAELARMKKGDVDTDYDIIIASKG